MHRLFILALLLGACGPQPPATPSPAAGEFPAARIARWDHELTALLPAIDACLAASPQTRFITYARRDGQAALVRMQGAEGTLECRQGSPGAAVQLNTLAAGDNISGEGEAIFVRAAPGDTAAQNPGGECYEAPEVRAADGALLGWMADPLGC